MCTFQKWIFHFISKWGVFEWQNLYIRRKIPFKKQKTAHGCGFLTQKIKKLAKKLYSLFGCEGVVRVDFLYDDKEKKLYVNEMNTIPGSLAFYLFKDIPFRELIRCVVEQSLLTFKQNQNLVTNFESDALNVFEDVEQVLKKWK